MTYNWTNGELKVIEQQNTKYTCLNVFLYGYYYTHKVPQFKPSTIVVCLTLSNVKSPFSNTDMQRLFLE